VVAPAVIEQAQAGAGADLDQGQRLRELGQGREQRGAAGDFVGLGATGAQHVQDLLGVLVRPAHRVLRILDGCVVPAQRPEQQVGLPPYGRNGAQQLQELWVTGDGESEPLVGRRPVAGLHPCPAPVVLGDLLRHLGSVRQTSGRLSSGSVGEYASAAMRTRPARANRSAAGRSSSAGPLDGGDHRRAFGKHVPGGCATCMMRA
jgi:hypothetical protein